MSCCCCCFCWGDKYAGESFVLCFTVTYCITCGKETTPNKLLHLGDVFCFNVFLWRVLRYVWSTHPNPGRNLAQGEYGVYYCWNASIQSWISSLGKAQPDNTTLLLKILVMVMVMVSLYLTRCVTPGESSPGCCVLRTCGITALPSSAFQNSCFPIL